MPYRLYDYTILLNVNTESLDMLNYNTIAILDDDVTKINNCVDEFDFKSYTCWNIVSSSKYAWIYGSPLNGTTCGLTNTFGASFWSANLAYPNPILPMVATIIFPLITSISLIG